MYNATKNFYLLKIYIYSFCVYTHTQPAAGAEYKKQVWCISMGSCAELLGGNKYKQQKVRIKEEEVDDVTEKVIDGYIHSTDSME